MVGGQRRLAGLSGVSAASSEMSRSQGKLGMWRGQQEWGPGLTPMAPGKVLVNLGPSLRGMGMTD